MSHPLDTTTMPARAVARCLNELATLLAETSDVAYVSRPPGEVSGSIGAHVRHCLDHVHAVLDAEPSGVLSYDSRRRQVAIEESRTNGIAALGAAVERLAALSAPVPDRPLTLDAQLDRDGGHVQVTSSVARELVFVLQHTIHHQALVALLLADQGVSVPRTFGYAPSTPR
jgi:uncharacterized damage-inducible protein DinB